MIPGLTREYVLALPGAPYEPAFRHDLERAVLGALMSKDDELAGPLAAALKIIAERQRNVH